MDARSLEAPTDSTPASANPSTVPSDAVQGLVATGSIIGALAVSSCCVLPLVLFSVGLGGAWIGNLTALAPYKPLIATATAGLLGYGFYRAYRKPTQACVDGTCPRPLDNRLVKLGLWAAAILAAAAFAFDYVAPSLLSV